MYLVYLSTAISLTLITTAEDIDGISSSSQHWYGVRTPLVPRFLDSPQNVSTFVDETAFLPCSVQHLRDRSVTWMRQRDLHILTVDMFTYSADNRYRVIHSDNSDDWTLQIYRVGPNDEGMYECQVNSDPKISRKVFLKVQEHNQLDDPGILIQNSNTGPPVFIQGHTERHIQKGSILTLTCVVRHPPREGPDDIFWYKDKDSLDYDSARRGVFIKVENKGRRSVSKLSISNITEEDSGHYICNPIGFKSAAVVVHVQTGQHQAAVYQSGLASSGKRFLGSNMIMFVLLLPFGLTAG